MFFWEKCNKHVMKVVPRYKIKVCVIDETDSGTFVIFDRDARLLFNQSCAEMFEKNDKKSTSGSLPKAISELVEKITFLFKVDFKNVCSSKFEQSFAVKKICNDPSIVTKFNDLYIKSVDANAESGYLDVGKHSIIDTSTIDLAHVFSKCVFMLVNVLDKCLSYFCAQNLISKFSTTVVDYESQSAESAEGESYDLSKDSEDLTPVKRDFKTQDSQADLELPLKILKKNIKVKIEKH